MHEKPMTTPPGSRADSKMSGGIIIAILAIIIIVLAGWAYLSGKMAVDQAGDNSPASVQGNIQPSGSGGNQADATDETAVKIFDLTAAAFKFSPTEIRVKVGDRVRINLAVVEGLHDWVIDEFNAKTKQITAGQSDSVEFTVNRSGTFEYYCSVGNHRQMGMVGKLIVAE